MKRSLFIGRLVFLCAVTAALTGCGKSEKLPVEGGKCLLNTDCTNPLSCNFGKCHRQCNENRDCFLGQRCVKVDGKGICQLNEEKACGPTTACMAPLACSLDNQCRTGCTTAADCLGTQTCVPGTTAGARVCAESTDLPGAAPDGGAADSGGGAGGAGAGGNDGSVAGSGGAGGGGGAGTPDAGGASQSSDGGSDTATGGTGGSAPGPDGSVSPEAGGGIDAVVMADASTGSYVAPTGPLVVDLSVAGEPVAPKGRILYSITVSNIATRAVDGVTVVMRTPPGVQYNYISDAQPNGFCNGGCYPDAEGKWTLGTIPAGRSRTITVSATVQPTVADATTIMATVNVTATGTNPISVSRAARVLITPSAQLSLGTLKDPVLAGETFTYDLDLGQLGGTALAGTELRATLPPGVVVGAISDGGTQPAPREVVWTIGAVPVGGVLHRSVDVTVEAGVPAGALLMAHAALKFDGGADVDLTADRTVTVLGTASPLKFDVAVGTNPAAPGGRVLYTVTVTNSGTRAVEMVSVFMRLPNGEQFNYIADAIPDGFCNGGCYSNTESVWSPGTIAAGASRTISVNASVVNTLVGDGNLMSAAFALVGKDVNDANLLKTVQVHGAPAAQLVLGATKDPLVSGGAGSLELDVGQIGPAALANTELRLTLPAGLTAGTISDGGTQPSPGVIVWPLGTVPVSGHMRRKVDVTVAAGVVAGTILTARSALTFDGGQAVDAWSETSISVVAAAPTLKLEVTATPNPVAPMGRLLYTATVTNTGARAIDKVAMEMRVPSVTQFNYVNDAEPDGFCNGGCYPDTVSSWDLGTLGAGLSKVITVNALVAATTIEGSLATATFQIKALGLEDTLNNRITVPVHK